MAKGYKGGATTCRSFTDGTQVCASKKAWSVFFATINRMGADETKARPAKKKTSEAVIRWFVEGIEEAKLKPPEAGTLPAHGKKILASAYESCRTHYPKYSKERCSKIAWAAVKNAGYVKDKEGKWKFSETKQMDRLKSFNFKTSKGEITHFLNPLSGKEVKVIKAPMGKNDGIAGFNNDGTKIYVDPLVPSYMYMGLITHETFEMALIEILKFKYKWAHEMATLIEHQTTDNLGINWNKYNNEFLRLLKVLKEREGVVSPKDLYRSWDEKRAKTLTAKTEKSRETAIKTQESKENIIKWFVESKLKTDDSEPKWLNLAKKVLNSDKFNPKIKAYWHNRLETYCKANPNSKSCKGAKD